jgi:hypothetical protein
VREDREFSRAEDTTVVASPVTRANDGNNDENEDWEDEEEEEEEEEDEGEDEKEPLWTAPRDHNR